MKRPMFCALCNYKSDRTDHVIRHMRLCHSNPSEYVGHKELTGYTCTVVDNDHPHIIMATHPNNQAVGYCTQCFTGFHTTHGIKNPAVLSKHFKTHTCAEKQVRTRKVVVKTEDASGNIVHKKEMQTGGVLFTAEMLEQYRKCPEYKYVEVEFFETHNNPVDVKTTIENAMKTASKFNNPMIQARLKAPVADLKLTPPPVPVAQPVQEGQIDWERVSKELCSHRRLKTYMPAQIQLELQRVEQTVTDSLTDADIEAEEMDWFDFMGTMVARSARYDALRKEKDALLDKMDCKEGEFKRNTFKMQQELEAALKREAERDEEIRTLRAALYQRDEHNHMLRAALEKCKSQQVISHE